MRAHVTMQEMLRDQHRHLSSLQEMPVLQHFLRLTFDAFDAR
jgi:hypothetical protein